MKIRRKWSQPLFFTFLDFILKNFEKSFFNFQFFIEEFEKKNKKKL